MRPSRKPRTGLLTAAALFVLWAGAACEGGGGTATAPQAVPTTPTAPASAIGNYYTRPCCCGFWTATLTRAGQTDTWDCWGWIEIREQSGTQISGWIDMEWSDGASCPADYGYCVNLTSRTAGQIDASGSLAWSFPGLSHFADQIGQTFDCTVVSGDGNLDGTLIGDTLSFSTGWVLSCSGKTAQLTLSGLGSR